MEEETQANSQVAVMEVAQFIKQEHNGKKEEEDTSLDGEFVKVEKETFDMKGNSVAEANLVESEVRSVTGPTDSSPSKELMDVQQKATQVDIELDKVTKALKESALDNAHLKNQFSSANEKLEQMANREEKLSAELKSKHMELSGIKEVFQHLDAEHKSSKQKMEELERALQSSVSDAKKFEELHMKSASQLQSEAKMTASLQDELKSLYEKIVVNEKVEASVKSKIVELEEKDSLIDEMHKELEVVRTSERQLKENMTALESILSATQNNYQVEASKLDEIQLMLSKEMSARESLEASFKSKDELLNKVAAEKEGLEMKLKRSEAEFGQADALSAEVIIKNAELEHKLKSLEELLTESQSSEASKIQKNVELEDLIKAANFSAEERRLQLQDREAKLERLELKNKELATEKEQMNIHMQEDGKKVSELESALEQLKEQKKVYYEDQLVEAASKAAALLEELNQASKKGAYLESSNEELKKMMEESKDRAAQSLSENELLSMTNSQLKCKLDELQQFLEASGAEKEEAARKLTAHMNTITEVAESKNVELDHTLVKVREQEKMIESLKAKLEQLETHTGALAEANMNLNEELSGSESKLKYLQSKLSAAVAEKDDAVKKLNSERLRLQTEMSSVMEQTQYLRETNVAVENDLHMLISQLEVKLKECQESNEAFKSELENLRVEAAQKSGLQARVKELEEKLLVTEAGRTKEGDDDDAEVRSRGPNLSSPTPRSASTIQAPSSLHNHNFKVVLAAALLSIIIGFIVAKR